MTDKELQRIKSCMHKSNFWEDFTDEELLEKTHFELIDTILEWEGIIEYTAFLHMLFEAVYDYSFGESDNA